MAANSHGAPSNVEAMLIRNALEQAGRDPALAARLLGISQTELQRRMRRYGLTMDGASDD